MAGSGHAGVDLDPKAGGGGDEDDGGAEGAAGAWEVGGWNVGQLDVPRMGAHTRRRRRSEKRSPFVSFCENLDLFLPWRRALGSEA